MERYKPAKSPNDPKDYLALQLQNGLKVLIVSDPECDKAAASVTVGVGSMNDPDELPGLAHLCEHLLSLEGSTTSDTKPFNAFISEHGGMFNAFTSRDQTNFHFDVALTAFRVALERFASFFSHMPILTEIDVEREIAIVHAEHESKINRDSWRKMAVEATTSKKNHAFRKFSTGNKTTLSDIPMKKGISVLKAAQEFRSTYYVANIMALTVYGKDSLKSLEELCLDLFSSLKENASITLPQWDEWPYGDDELRKRIDIVSHSDIRDMFLIFPMADTRPFYKTFPHGYLTRIIGNRGPGSLYSYLADMQFVETSYMNASVLARGFAELSVGFQLSKLGMDNIDKIAHLCFQYIKMIRDKGPQEPFWKEMQEVMYLKFLHQDKEVAVDFCQRMSNLLHVYPLNDILTVGSILTDYNASLLQQFMDYMNPDNCRILTVCKANGEKNVSFSHDHWYGAKFTETKFSDQQIEEWKTCNVPDFFSLPRENKYIPSNFELKHRKNETLARKLSWTPIPIEDSPLCKAWFLPDEEFQQAKGVIRLDIFSQLSIIDPVSYNLNQIWFLTLKSILSDHFYQATVAGAYHGVKPTLHGVEITVSGFSDKLLVLANEMFQAVIDSAESSGTLAKYFSTFKDRYATNLVNLKNLTPANLTNRYLSLLLRDRRFSYDELFDALPDTTEERLSHYMKGFFYRTYFEWMIYGNFKLEEATELIQTCSERVQKTFRTRALLPSQNARPREVYLSPGVHFIYQDTIPGTGNSCGILIQLGVLNTRESIIAEIIDQIIYEPLFTQLRNQQQIGYIVRSSIRKSNGCQGILIFVQGDKEPAEMSARVFSVLSTIEDRLLEMKAPEFTQHKSAVRLRKSERPKSMLQLFNKHLWNNEILSRRYDFGIIERELALIESISYNEVLQFFKDHVSNSSPSRRIMHIHLHSCRDLDLNSLSISSSNKHRPPSASSTHPELNGNKCFLITDIIDWKMKMSLCPLYPYNK